MLTTFQPCTLYYVNEAQSSYIQYLQSLIDKHVIDIILNLKQIEGKFNQKRLCQLIEESPGTILLLDDKNHLSLLSQGLSAAPEWDKLQRRVVGAGRKSELLLKATKLTENSVIIDATAGFGHDSLILASTGAQVIMLEQQPVMALLLLVEQQRMNQQPNWQKLMARLHIINTNALSYFSDFSSHRESRALNSIDVVTTATVTDIDVVYLDPMFPIDSYENSKTGKGAKVGKHMQALHHLAHPPTLIEEAELLKSALEVVSTSINTSININTSSNTRGRVIVKRPSQAAFFAMQSPDESWHNEAVRFDGYFT